MDDHMRKQWEYQYFPACKNTPFISLLDVLSPPYPFLRTAEGKKKKCHLIVAALITSSCYHSLSHLRRQFIWCHTNAPQFQLIRMLILRLVLSRKEAVEELS